MRAGTTEQGGVLWIDITNAPHVRFFLPFLPGWRDRYGVTVTARPHSNTLDLLASHGIDAAVIGGHGSTRIGKIFELASRVIRLALHLRRHRPVAGVSQSSFYSPPAGFLAGIPTLYTNDNEHAEGNRIAFRFASLVLVPEAIPDDDLVRQGAPLARTRRYPGVKEAMYLASEVDHLRRIRTTSARERAGRPRIYARTEPWKAQYYSARDDHLMALLRGIAERMDVHVLPRGEAQAKRLADDLGQAVTIRRDVVTLDELATSCSLFLSAGGTMGRETAVLGIPTVSIYKGQLLAVDKWLIGRGLFRHEPDLDAGDLEHLARHYEVPAESRDEVLDAGWRARQVLEQGIEQLVLKEGKKT